QAAVGAGTPAAGDASGPYRDALVEQVVPKFEAAMSDDFNTAKVVGDLSDVFKLANEILDKPQDADVDARTLRRIAADLREVGTVLGLFVEDPAAVLGRMDRRRQQASGVDAAEVEHLIQARND